MGARRARRRPGRIERGAPAASLALRARHLHGEPRHRGRHDRQQFQRRAIGSVRQDDRSRARARGGAGRREHRASSCPRAPRARSRLRRPGTGGRRPPDGAHARSRLRGRDRASVSQGAAPRRRLQPRRVCRRVKTLQPRQDHRRLGGNARPGGRCEDQPCSLADRQGGAGHRVRRFTGRARGDAVRAAPSAVGGRGDGPLHPRSRA